MLAIGYHIQLRGRWCSTIVFYGHEPREEKCDDSKDRFYEELGQVFGHFAKYHMKILLGYFNVKVAREKFSNRQMGMRVYIRIVMKVVLE